MKKNILRFLICMTLFASCGPTEPIDVYQNVTTPTTPEEPLYEAPTPEEYSALCAQALSNCTQVFTCNGNDNFVTCTAATGVVVTINTQCLTLNGNAITGDFELEYSQIFNRGTMLVAGTPTMGLMPDGNKGLIISGGEFYINATQNGQQLELSCPIQMSIPGDYTGGADSSMTLWLGAEDENGNFTWQENDPDNGQDEGVWTEGGNYYAYFNHFGWTNVDRWYCDPRPKTTLLVDAPNGYDNTNSAVYISYNEEGNALLAMLDVYDAETGYFSEHYGQIPIELECNVIFVSENDGNWIYAIKAVTIEENSIITFTDAELQTATEEELIALIDALP